MAVVDVVTLKNSFLGHCSIHPVQDLGSANLLPAFPPPSQIPWTFLSQRHQALDWVALLAADRAADDLQAAREIWPANARPIRQTKQLNTPTGPVLRITLTLLLVSDSRKLPEIYHSQANKSDHYVSGAFGKSESVFNMKEHKMHARFRKLIPGPYSFTNIKKMEPLIDNRMQEWVDRLQQAFAKTGKPFDLCAWAVYMAYDIVSEIGFVPAGTDIGALIQGFHDGMTAFGLLARFHPFTTWIKSTWLGREIPRREAGR
jgi:cytochrome P450